MATFTLSAAINKFLKKLTLTGGEQTELRTLIDAASFTDTQAALGNKQPLDADLTAYANAADAAARRALIGAASDDSPNFNSPTALTAPVGDRSSLLATTEFVWGNGPLKALPPSGPYAGSLQAQYGNIGGVTPNPPGYGSVDLQASRQYATETASGNFSFITGKDNTASGVSSFAGGLGCTASGPTSYAFGQSNVASGAFSFAKGRSCTASGTYSVAQGYATEAETYGEFAHGAASPNTQVSRFDLYKETTNLDATILTVDGASTKLVISPDWAMAGTINILGVKTTNGAEAAHYIRKFAIKNVGGTVALIGTATTVGTDYESDAGLDVAITANDSTDSLDITVTGLAATTIRWAACVDAVEVKLT